LVSLEVTIREDVKPVVKDKGRVDRIMRIDRKCKRRNRVCHF
jgi:hypothetical protein